MAHHRAVISWQRDGQDFLDRRYSRAHLWRFDGGTEIAASPAPSVVPAPLSVEANIDPEEAFVASLASCHMLFFLDLCSKAGLMVDHYEDHAAGRLGKNEQGRIAMLSVTLQPAARFSGEHLPSRQTVTDLHHIAHERCFIANSVRTRITVEPVW